MKGRWFAVCATLIVLALTLLAGTVLAQTELTIDLTEQNSSGENGTATFTDLGNNQVRVDVTIENAPAGVTQPMHIHQGTCENLDPAPAFPLTSLVDGKSTTVVSTTLESLTLNPYAVNGHKSADEASVYVFCGNIAQAAAQVTETVTATTAVEMTETPAATSTAAAEATGAATETVTATVAAETTPSVTGTPTPQLPTTGTTPNALLIPILIAGVIILLVGLGLRRAAR